VWAALVTFLLFRRKQEVERGRDTFGFALDRRWGVGIGALNLVAVAALMLFGPAGIASEEDLGRQLPIYLGLTGYRLVMAPDSAAPVAAGTTGTFRVSATLGPSPLVWPPTSEGTRQVAPYHFVVPGLSAEDDDGLPLNDPSAFSVWCNGKEPGAHCELDLRAGSRRRDYLPAVEVAGRWQWLGGVPIPSGGAITIEPVPANGHSRETRLINVHIEGDTLRLNDCPVKVPADGETILPVADLYYVDQGCKPRDILPQDLEGGLWLRPGKRGNTDVPAYSFLAVRPGPSVELVALQDRAFKVTSSVAQGTGGGARSFPFALGETLRLAVARRVFTARTVSKDCDPKPDFAGCLRLKGRLDTLPWIVQVKDNAPRLELAIDIDRAEPLWRPLAWTELTPDQLVDADRYPIRFSFEQGRWRSGEPRPPTSGERLLELPFRLLGGLPYSAQLVPRLSGVDGATLIVHDSARQSMHFERGTRLELGPEEARAVMEFERAPSPRRPARAAIWPLFAAAAGLLVFLFLVRPEERRGHAPALLASCGAVVVAYGQLLRAHVGFAVVVHEPWDPNAFVQVVLSSAGLAASLVLATLSGVAVSRSLPDRFWKAMEGGRPSVAGGVLFVVAVSRLAFSIRGREALGPFRFVLIIAPLMALIWYVLSRHANDDRAPRSRLRTLWYLALAAFSVFAWAGDFGAVILLLAPTAVGLVVLWSPGTGQIGRVALPSLLLFALVLGGVFRVPERVLSLAYNLHEIPAVEVGHRSACAAPAAREENKCWLSQAARSSSPAETNALDVVEDTIGEVGAHKRRKRLRVLDWIEDGNDASTCFAAERFPTVEGLEVAFFRAQIRRYRDGGGDRAYLRDGLLPFALPVQKSLLNDYLGAAAFAPQMPPGSLAATAFLLVALAAAAVLIFPRALRSSFGAGGLGAIACLGCASVLTVAANLDVLPNFAQSIPLVAIRSETAWLIDAAGLGVALFLLALTERDPA
jgi:hypothetical protein